MVNRPLSRCVTRISGRRLMGGERRCQYRREVGLTWHVLSQIALIHTTTSRAKLNAPVGSGEWQTRQAGGGLGPKTRLRWQLIPLLKSGKPPMDHLPPASSQHKDSGSCSSFTQEGVDQSDGVRWCVEIRIANVTLTSVCCQYTVFKIIFIFSQFFAATMTQFPLEDH